MRDSFLHSTQRRARLNLSQTGFLLVIHHKVMGG
jgi:hypothetical protein